MASFSSTSRILFRSIVTLSCLGLWALASSACDEETDGSGGSGGEAELFCGDGFADSDLGEECDDGNLNDEDDCTTQCLLAKCGDGLVKSETEDCDDGNQDNTDGCLATCVIPSCGDGFVHSGVEQCDDGNNEDGDACSSTCTAGVGCGNGQLENGEECDDGNTSNADACTSQCNDAFCGDGYAWVGMEDCDDGNSTDTDSCKNNCTVGTIENYACPGTAASVSIGGNVTLGANTQSSMDSYQGSCGGGGAAEVVYAITAQASGLLIVDMIAINNDLDPVLYARSGSCEGGAEIGCGDQTFTGGYESLQIAAQAGQTYYVFADGWNGTSGEFLLDVTLLGSVPGDSCPGLNIPISTFNTPYPVTGNTSAATADWNGTGLCNSAATKDIVYRVTPPMNAKIVAALNPSAGFDASLYARTTCTSSGSQVGCSEVGNPGELEILTIPANAGNTVYFFVDGWQGASGAFDIEFTLLPP